MKDLLVKLPVPVRVFIYRYADQFIQDAVNDSRTPVDNFAYNILKPGLLDLFNLTQGDLDANPEIDYRSEPEPGGEAHGDGTEGSEGA